MQLRSPDPLCQPDPDTTDPIGEVLPISPEGMRSSEVGSAVCVFTEYHYVSRKASFEYLAGVVVADCRHPTGYFLGRFLENIDVRPMLLIDNKVFLEANLDLGKLSVAPKLERG